MLKNVSFIFLIIIVASEIISKKDENEDVFIPTHEWQVVKKGQKIPRGLHVRMNLETGKTEAKLLNEVENDKQKAVIHIPQEHDGDEKTLKPSSIKEALKKIKGDDVLEIDEIQKVKEKFRSYNELKKEMNELNLTPKLDAEVLKDLFEQYEEEIKKDKINVDAILRILEDFDFLAHQFDNAVEFSHQNGFKEVIYKNLNMSDSQIKQATLKLFGSLVQNNGKVQIHALESGGVNILLRTLHLEQLVDVKSKALYALSCLLRRFPLAQLRFVESGGISVVTEILEKDPLKIQTKLVTFLNDLLIENIQAIQDSSSDNRNILVSQYQLVNLEKLLLEQDWCQYLNKLLFSLLAADPDDHDSIEKCILAMHTISNKCVGKYSKDILTSLQDRYMNLALSDSEKSDEWSNSDFFMNIYELCKNILQQKNIKTEL
ncbi:hypothetical protein NQ315_013430 [Exocentrus adspersus]|uniref:Nucleotide exchange factor SIL1 n=1 Tax=Exocentrus adspersus TaxID=1586481 RepID=A0AAV8VHD3_9CUCU|nr:hypothetical protein NQ315_013430 [Exocentrus adspersus]